MPKKYKIDTDKGSFLIETDEPDGARPGTLDPKTALETNLPQVTPGTLARDYSLGIFQGMGGDPNSPVVGTAKNALHGLFGLVSNPTGTGRALVQQYANLPNAIRNATARGEQGQAAEEIGQATAPVAMAAPAVMEAAAGLARSTNLAEALRARAGANRAPLPPYSPADAMRDALTDTAGAGIGGVIGGPSGAAIGGGSAQFANLLRRTNIYRGGKAAIQEGIAKALSKNEISPAFSVPTPQGFDVPSSTSRPNTAIGGGSLRPAYTPPENMPPLPSAPAISGEFPGQSNALLNARVPAVSPVNQRFLNALRSETVLPDLQGRMEQSWTNRGDVSPLPQAATGTGALTTYQPPPDTGLPSFSPQMNAPQVNRWMNVKTSQLTHGADPGMQILRDGLLGPTKEATLGSVDAALKSTGVSMDSLFEDAAQKGITIDTQDVVMNALDDATKTIGKRTDAGFQQALSNVLDDILHKHPQLDKMTPAAAHSLKVDLGDAVHWNSGAMYEADLNRALMNMYGQINSKITSAVDGIGPVQAKWGNLYQARKSLRLSLLKDRIGSGTGAVPKGH